MEKLPPENLLKLWQKGKTLEKACFEFCDAKYIHAFPKQAKIKSPQNYSNKSPLSIITEGLQKLSEISKQQQDYQTAHKQAWDNLVKNLSDKITQNELIAIGYETPINSDFPVYVPLHMWPPENIDMAKSVISSHEKTYVRVKILKPELNTLPLKPIPNIKVESVKVGRPSVINQIISTYKRLQKEGKIDFSKSFQAHHELLIKSIQAIYNTEVSGKTLHKYLGKVFREEKKKSTN